MAEQLIYDKGGKEATVKGFFAYPSTPPAIPPTIGAAIESINRTEEAHIVSWESLHSGGNYIIDAILAAIDESQYFCADVTGLNPNVMFELGYAIAADKRIWLVRDESYVDVRKEFDQMRFLTTITYRSYLNSDQLNAAFFEERPDQHLKETIWNSSIESVLAKEVFAKKILYLKNLYESEASLRINRAVEQSRLDYVVSDPRETTVRPAYWFAQHLFDSPGLIAHFMGAGREGSKIHNARYAFVCGMARGFGVPVLMLAEEGPFLAPLDYRDLLQTYVTPNEAYEHAAAWLGPRTPEGYILEEVRANKGRSLKLATELKDFHVQLGEYVAEEESNTLNEYFIETTVSDDIATGTQNVFVGRKGSGKSANLIRVEATIGADSRNLVCVIRPLGYEIEGLVRLFSSYKLRDTKGYVIESLWKFMIYTELAQALVRQIESDEAWRAADDDVISLMSIVTDDKQAFTGDFPVRLERLITSLGMLPHQDSSELFQKGVSEAVHSVALSKLRLALGKVLSTKNKVYFLVDNLDRSWTKDSDLSQLAEFLLGLLTATSRVALELNRAERDRKASDFSSAIFLRSDIFERVQEAAREPDKLSFTRIRWEDDELLLRVIEERYVASHGSNADPAHMWRKYFCSNVRGIATREYITSRILKRPRDIVFLVKRAVANAVNRKHDRVEEKDITDAERDYGLYAIDSILVENGSIIPKFEDVMFAFSGGNSTLTETELRQMVSGCGLDPEETDGCIDSMVRLSFLGLEVDENQFAFSEESRELKQSLVLANRFKQRSLSERRYQINPAFQAYLRVQQA